MTQVSSKYPGDLSAVWGVTSRRSTRPRNRRRGPANGIKPGVHQVVVGFAQQQLQAPSTVWVAPSSWARARRDGITANVSVHWALSDR